MLLRQRKIHLDTYSDHYELDIKFDYLLDKYRNIYRIQILLIASFFIILSILILLSNKII